MTEHPSTTLGIIGLGYVGLPLAVEAGRAGINVIGFDVNPSVVDIVNSGGHTFRTFQRLMLRSSVRVDASRQLRT